MRFTRLAVLKQITLLACLLLCYVALAAPRGRAARAAAPAPLPAVVQSGSTAYLSDLPTCSAKNGWGPFERDRSNGETGETDGSPITLNGVTYTKGLGVHAYSELRFCLGGAYTQFVSDIGVDDYVGAAGSVIFSVYADNVLLYDSGVMTGSSATKNVAVSIAGRQELRLVVTDAGNDADSDHGDWAGAYLVRGTPTTTTAYASDLSWLSSTNGWGPAERDLSNGETAPGDGGRITLNGVAYTKGIGMHSAYPQADLRINLAGAYSSFQASVGVDDYVGPYGSVVFRVYADGVLLYDSGVMTGSSATKAVNVSVAGRNELRLVVTDGGDGGENDHADWANARLLFKNDPATAGLWCNRVDWPTVAIHTHLLPDGKVMFWGRDKVPGTNTDVDNRSYVYIWDPLNESITRLENTRTNLFCSGHSFLPDGKLLISGGHDSNDGYGEPHINIFDYAVDYANGQNPWTAGPDMNAGRWYPSNAPLANGETLILSGTKTPNVINPLPQVRQTGGTLRWLTGAEDPYLPTYPWLFLAPNGNVFNAGPSPQSNFLSTGGGGAWLGGPPARTTGDRHHGSAVMYDGKVLIFGGEGQEPTNSVEQIDLNPGANQTWVRKADMNYPRAHLNTVILPDGKTLATGGTRLRKGVFNNAQGSVFPAEVYDPAANKWTPLASMKVRRLYHSTAILLPDGRVLSAGGGLGGEIGGDTAHPDMEIYLPPYLFKGPRPTITSAPTSVGYGQTFFVGTPNATVNTKVTWIRLPSVTHSFNQNQRFNRLDSSPVSGGLYVTAPSSANASPPGHYMLFVVDGNGVPSAAKIVRVG